MRSRQMTFKYRRLLADFVPIVAALVFALIYFFTVVPYSRLYLTRYFLVMLGLLILDRIVLTWYFRTKLLPPLVAYKRGRREGRTFTKPELAALYKEFVAHVPRSQVLSLVAWVVAATALATVSYVWIQHSWLAFFGILFTGAIAASISVSTSYFFVKWLITPVIEEVMAGLDQLPDVSRFRADFKYKVGLSVMAIGSVAFLAFGVLVFSRLSTALDEFATRSGRKDALAVAEWLTKSSPEEWPGVLKAQGSPLWTLVVVSAGGAENGVASGPFDPVLLKDVVKPGQALAADTAIHSARGTARLYPLPGDRYLALVANPESLRSLMTHLAYYEAGFLVMVLLFFGAYVLLLSRDMTGSLERMLEFNERLASGDLSQVPAIWADDELGTMADSLRTTFQSLNRTVLEVSGASSAVDAEVARAAEITERLHREVASQVYFADRTTQSVKAMEEGMLRVSRAMIQVANATQEVSSTILELQASVEEIARNSDVLIRSVEKTVSSSNQISASATEVNGATDRLQHSGQEAVSFLAELDASLEETRRNAQALSASATKMTQDAEAGFTSVAAVEEEILRTSRATEQSRDTLRDLVSSIEKIGRIVDVIQDVTEQTNLLSLNASIIAAGAGEYGKSFAVVATQIRELSARTAGNAKEIRTLIRSLTTSGSEMASSMDRTYTVVANSATLSRTAGDALRTILESASSQEEMNKRIASATEELAHGGQSANRAMHRIFEMIEGIGKATKDQVSSTRYLNEEAERVRDVALQLRNATEEQAKGTRVISEAITHIMEDSRQTTQAIQAQTQESRAIYDAMQQVATAAQAVERAFGELSEAASHLQRSASTLRQEARTFKTA